MTKEEALERLKEDKPLKAQDIIELMRDLDQKDYAFQARKAEYERIQVGLNMTSSLAHCISISLNSAPVFKQED